MSGRGAFADEIGAKLAEFFGRPSSVAELRLIPYAHYCLTNSQNIESQRINGEEREILSLWRNAGLIHGGLSDFAATKPFFDFMNEILWHAYVVPSGGAKQ